MSQKEKTNKGNHPRNKISEIFLFKSGILNEELGQLVQGTLLDDDKLKDLSDSDIQEYMKYKRWVHSNKRRTKIDD